MLRKSGFLDVNISKPNNVLLTVYLSCAMLCFLPRAFQAAARSVVSSATLFISLCPQQQAHLSFTETLQEGPQTGTVG